jgi:peptide/nickel transport system substrate-binding protein
MLRRRTFAGAALAALLAPGPAGAQKTADTLRVSWRDAVPDLDPYRNQLRTGFVLAHHIWDCLVDRDPETFQLRPLLAASWKQESDTAVLFKLRAGVRFHDGSGLTADDVAYTVQSVRTDPTVAVPGLFTWLAGAEVVDPLTVRIALHEPFPAALEYLTMVLPILPRAYRERVGPAEFGRMPVGTGPYRVVPAEVDGPLLLERFDDYIPDGPKGRPEIARIAIHAAADAQAEYTDLLAERADWIWQIGPSEIAAIAQARDLQVLRGESMRIGYLSMDAAGRSGVGSPLTDARVRRAMCHAIDRNALLRRLAGVAARVPEAPCFPTQFGCDGAAAEHYPYDPARARALLAEAGYASGFATDLVSYVLSSVGEFVRTALQTVGITANLVQLPTSAALARAEAGNAPLFLGSWGSYSINDVAAILPQFFGGGPLDYARVPDLMALIKRAGRNGDADTRRGLYGQAIRQITGDALWLPLHTYQTTFGISRTLNFRPPPDELPRFYLASWR